MAEADLCQVVGCRRLRVDGKRGTWILEPWLGWDGVGIGITHYLLTHRGWGGETTTASSDASGCSSQQSSDARRKQDEGEEVGHPGQWAGQGNGR